jgi:hypothetical protein
MLIFLIFQFFNLTISSFLFKFSFFPLSLWLLCSNLFYSLFVLLLLLLFYFFLGYLTINCFIHIRLVGLLLFPVIAAFHKTFSHYSHPSPSAALGHTETGSRTGIRAASFRVSPSPPPPTLFWFFILPVYSFIFLIFTVGLFGIRYSVSFVCATWKFC